MNNNIDNIKINKVKTITSKDILKVFIRSNIFQGSWNFERMQALGFCFSITPIINKLYPENNDNKIQAIRRHLEFFNTHPYAVAPILGVIIAMEEQKARGLTEINDATINGLKVGLMGPLAGIGDPIFWGTLRPICAALGSGMAMTGGILGPVMFFILFNSVRLTIRYYGIFYGYKKGLSVITDISGNFLKKLTEGSSILGLFVMGALVNKWTHINIPCIISCTIDDKGVTSYSTVQNILDQLLPGLAPLILTLICMWVLKKHINPLWIITILFGVGILGNWLNILSL